jgi:pyrimidine deaminase RibD-like protein
LQQEHLATLREYSRQTIFFEMMMTMVPSARRNNNKHVVLVVAALSLFCTLMPTMISSFVPLMTTSRAQRQQSQPPSMPDSVVKTTLSGRRSSRRNKNRAPRSSESGEVEILVEREEVEEVQEEVQEEEPEVELEKVQQMEEQVEIEEIVSTTTIAEEEEDESVSVEDEDQLLLDESHMRLAIEYAKAQTDDGAYPNPTVGAVLISSDGQVLGLGRSTYAKDAIQDVLEQSGLDITPLREWCVTWPSQSSATWKLRDDLASATLYVTLEPISGRRGESLPPITQLIELSGVSRIVIGAPDPVPERAGNGAQALHRQSGCDVSMGRILTEECVTLISPYIERVNSKFHIMARNHRRRHGRPLGLLHCSVVDSDNIEAFAQMGNAFGTSFGGKTLSFRDFGSYEMAPPPEHIWANDDDDVDDDAGKSFSGLAMSDDDDDEDEYGSFFGDTEEQKRSSDRVIMPWYDQVDAVIGTFPRVGRNGMYFFLLIFTRTTLCYPRTGIVS